MHNLYLALNGKGGTGKNTFCRLFSHYLTANGHAHKLVSFDTSPRDIPAKDIGLILKAAKESALVVAETAGYYDDALLTWLIGEGGLTGIQLTLVIPVTIHADTVNSLRTFLQSCSGKAANRIRLVVVLNYFAGAPLHYVESNIRSEVLAAGGLEFILDEIPRYVWDEAYSRAITVAEALELPVFNEAQTAELKGVKERLHSQFVRLANGR